MQWQQRRAGAHFVTGAEISQHMCDVAAETVIVNGYGAKCIMVRLALVEQFSLHSRRMGACLAVNSSCCTWHPVSQPVHACTQPQ